MRNVEENLEENDNFIEGTFELIQITNNQKDLVENKYTRLQLSQREKENKIKTNLENILEFFN